MSAGLQARGNRNLIIPEGLQARGHTNPHPNLTEFYLPSESPPWEDLPVYSIPGSSIYYVGASNHRNFMYP